MAENKFDKENIYVPAEEELPSSFMVWGDEKVYDIKDKLDIWWQCPKCGSDISFDSNEEGFDEDIREKQFTTAYAWWCEECSARGTVFAVVNPLYITIEQNKDEDED